MAKDIRIANVDYNDVPALDIPLQDSGYARFYDVEGSQEYQQNGTYDVKTLSQIVVNVSGGSGATNIVKGTFTTGSSTAAAESHTIPYTGDGYPVAFFCWVKGGPYASGSVWYNLVQRYAVGVWCGIKSNMSSEPTYGTSGAANQGTTIAVYKSSASSATSYTRTSAMSANMFSSSNANSTATTNIRFRSKTQISVFVAGTSYGLPKETEFEYVAVYSS